MRKRLLAMLLAMNLLMAGCKGSTTISRGEQLGQLDTQSTTQEDTVAAAKDTTQDAEDLTTTPETAESTAAEQDATQAVEETEPRETTVPATEATKPAQQETKEPEQETTVPVTTEQETEEVTTEVTTEPEPEETTEAATEEEEPPQDSYEDLEYAILSVINEYRSRNGLGALTMDSRLAEVALIRAEECAVKFSHTRPDGREWYTALDDYGYSWRHSIAENLLRGYLGMSARAMVDAWMDSNGHRKNILNGEMTVAGISAYVSGDAIYVVNLFEG